MSSLEVIIHAAAPCPVPVKEQMIEWFGPILLEYYAATEGNGATFITSEDWLAHKGSVGRAVLSEIRILDDDGHPCPVGTPGTVWFAGATDFEYFNDPEKTASSRRDGGKTSTVGDVGYLDEDGYLFLTDRKAHMIISGGVNIYPQETENLLVTHPAGARRRRHRRAQRGPGRGGQGGRAARRRGGGRRGRSSVQLIAFCREHLAHFKCPRTVDFVDELPRLPTGKLYKGVLREQYWADHSTRASCDAVVGGPWSWGECPARRPRVVDRRGRRRPHHAGRPQPGGARKEAWFVDLERPDGTVSQCFLRYDRSDPSRTKDPWTLHREATVYLALQDGPVPVPRVLGVHPVHQAMLSERVAGRELVLPHHRPRPSRRRRRATS